MGIEEHLLEFARDLYDAIGWPGVVFLMAIESACIPFPSEIIMPLAGWFLVKDQGLGWEWLIVAALFGALGNTIGSLIAYYAGAWGGRAFLLRYGRYLLITPRDLDTADRWFARYGDRAAFISRLLPVIRTFISLPAGISRVNAVRFTVLTFVGSFFWSLGLAAAGYALGEHWDRILPWFRPVSIPIAIAVVIAFAWHVWHRMKELRQAPAAREHGE